MFHSGLVSSICFQRSGFPGEVKGGRGPDSSGMEVGPGVRETVSGKTFSGGG